MRKAIILLVAALALVASVAAYSSATVSAKEGLKIASADTTLLAIIPSTGVGNQDNTISIDNNNQVVLNIGRNGSGNVPGIQPFSRYQFDCPATVRNNSTDNVKFRLDLDTWSGNVAKYVPYVFAYPAGSNQYDAKTAKFVNQGQVDANAYYTLPSGQSACLFIKAETTDQTGPIGTYSGQMLFSAEAVQ